MARRSLPHFEGLAAYIRDLSPTEPEVLQRLRAETDPLPQAGMQIGPDQGAFMGMLVRLMGAKRILEIGTFTGYSSLAMALALPEDGRLVACDHSEEWTSVARRYWDEAGLADQIELRLGPAREALEALIAEGEPAFDLAFIDADKTGYAGYFGACLRLVRPGGLILADNTLQGGKVTDPEASGESLEAIRAFNKLVAEEPRVEAVIVPLGDGVTFARVRD
jgi:predicted O-methyltransferase YrrM